MFMIKCKNVNQPVLIPKWIKVESMSSFRNRGDLFFSDLTEGLLLSSPCSLRVCVNAGERKKLLPSWLQAFG